MKKILFFVCVAMAMVGCKDKTDGDKPKKSAVATPAQVNCNHPLIAGLEKAIDDGEAEDYIKNHGTEICEAGLGQCIVGYHAIGEQSYTHYTENHVENQQGGSTVIKEYPVTWGEIESFFGTTNCYEKYLGFDFIEGNISLKLIKFSTAQTCYSKVFLTGLKDTLHMSSTDEFIFTKAMVPDPKKNNTLREKIIFKINKSGNLYFYDLSDFPGIVERNLVNPS